MKKIAFVIFTALLFAACETEWVGPTENEPGVINTIDANIDPTVVSQDNPAKTKSGGAISLIDDLIAEVNQLMADGDISNGPGQSILSKLQSIRKKLVQGKISVALSKLDELINHMEELVAEGVLDPEIFNDLLAEVEAVACELDPLSEGCLAIGDLHAGGIIFYLDASGNHGLVAATSDFTTIFQWGCQGTDVVGAGGFAIGTGAQNTLDIVNDLCHQTDGQTSSAEACHGYSVIVDGTLYDDWFLPSVDEAYLMKSNLHDAGLGNFNGTTNYATSTEQSAVSARFMPFHSDHPAGGVGQKDPSHNRTRAVRAF